MPTEVNEFTEGKTLFQFTEAHVGWECFASPECGSTQGDVKTRQHPRFMHGTKEASKVWIKGKNLFTQSSTAFSVVTLYAGFKRRHTGSDKGIRPCSRSPLDRRLLLQVIVRLMARHVPLPQIL